MRDLDIRKGLYLLLSEEFKNDLGTLIIDELGLCQGKARVDIAAINGEIHGFEIKSEEDTLERLPGQIEIYNKVLDTVTIIAGCRHVDEVVEKIPRWWGVIEASPGPTGQVEFSNIRSCERNPDTDPFSIVQLLWRDEALDLLEALGADRGYRSKKREKIWRRIIEITATDVLKSYIRVTLKLRRDWRSGRIRALNGDWFLPAST